MVSFWPWRRDDSSPASFEKALSALSAKISQTATTLDGRRNQARRVRALWTLYAGIAYLLYLVVAILVVGWRAWGPVEYGVAGGGPFVVYGVRRGLDAAFGYRVRATETRLQDLKGQRDKTIAQLKEATRYDSTQALLDKYGGEKGEKGGARKRVKNEGSQEGQQQPNTPARRDQPRTTGFAPPPTANIPGRQSLPAQFSPGYHGPASGQPSPAQSAQGTPQQQQQKRDPLAPSASFAPNAFANTPQSQHAPHSPSHLSHELSSSSSPPASPGPVDSALNSSGGAWYDRLLDVLLGDDEAAARNRLALLCTSCGLVNGLAPPGAKNPADVGRWRCSSCGAWNGVAKEVASKEEDTHGGGKGGSHGLGGAGKKKPRRRDTMDAVVQEVQAATGVSVDEIRRRMGDVMKPAGRESAVQEENEDEEEESDRTIYSETEEEETEEQLEEGQGTEDDDEEEEEEESPPPKKVMRARKAKATNDAAAGTKTAGSRPRRTRTESSKKSTS